MYDLNRELSIEILERRTRILDIMRQATEIGFLQGLNLNLQIRKIEQRVYQKNSFFEFSNV